jgi:predicted metal-dependent hydrolase
MKVNKKTKRLVQKLVRHYCKKMKLGIPQLVLEILYDRDLEQYDHWGKYIFADDILYINVKIHVDKTNLANTIVHELTHKKHPRLRHGDKFNKIVDHYCRTT